MFDVCNEVDAVNTDFSRAFDIMPCSLLLVRYTDMESQAMF